MGANRVTSVLHEVEPGSHVAHFYSDDESLASSVAQYAREGSDRGEGVVLIAEPRRLEVVRHALSDERVGPERGILLLEVDVVLQQVMVGGLPAPGRFAEVVGRALQSTLLGRTGVRAYGEMVDKLWREGNVTGALALEGLWNELALELPFTLYCAYRDALVVGLADGTALDATCRLHSSVVGEGDLAPRTSACRHFGADGADPSRARAFVLAALRTEDAALADAAALVVSELATNAIRHGGTGFSVTVSFLTRGVRIAVGDGRPEPPVLRSSSVEDPGGRGLRIVDAVCRDWGTTRRYDGKAVWAELDR